MFLWIPKVTPFSARVYRAFLWRFAISVIVWSKPGDVWVFRVFCRRARWFFEFLWQSLSLCRAGSDVLLSLSVVRSKGDVSRVFVAFCYLFHSVIQRWRLGVSSFLPTSSLVFWRPNLFWDMSFQRLTRFVVLEAIFFLSLEGSVGNVSPVFRFRFRSVFGRFGLGFRWCLAFSHPLPTRAIFVFVCATVVVQLLRSFSCL